MYKALSSFPHQTTSMESTFSATTLFTLSETLNSSSKPLILRLYGHFSRTPLSQQSLSVPKRFSFGRIRCISNGGFQRSNEINLFSSSPTFLCSFCIGAPISSRLACVSSAVSVDAALASGGGSDDGFNGGKSGGGGGGGGDGGSDGGGETKLKSVVGEPEELSSLSPDVIILDVGGMSCGGCAGKVKRILESQPQVSSAIVNLATETAIVWPVPEAKETTQNWQQQLGETLAKHLTSCGFKSNFRGQVAIEVDIPK